MNWFLKALRQYADFSGRARRKEYWMYTLFAMLTYLVALGLDTSMDLGIGGLPYGPFYLITALALLIPGLAVSVRRMHDLGKSGWMLLIALIPLVGSIWLLVLLASNGQPHDNNYGSDPKLLQ